MTLSNLQRQWKNAASTRHLKIKMPFSLRLANGSRVTAEVLLDGYGAPRGMLIFSNYRHVKDHKNAITEAGYGYTCMPQPSPQKITSMETIDQALRDWSL